MNEENHDPNVSEDQEKDEFDPSKLLEMAKLFSTLMADDKDESEDKDKDEVDDKNSGDTKNPGQNNIFQMLEMAKLFSNLLGNKEMQNQPQVVNTPPVVPLASSILFDETVHTPQMKVIKAAIPYMEINHQKVLGVFVKFLELKKVVDIYKNNNAPLSANSLSTSPHWKIDMLNSIRPHCTEEKQCMVDMMAKIMDISDLMKKMSSIKSTEASKPQLVLDKPDQKQTLLQAISPMLNENQRQMLSMLTTLMGSM